MGASIDRASGRTESQGPKGRDLKVEADPGSAPPHRVTPLGHHPARPTQLAPPTALPPAESHLCLSDKAGVSGSPGCLHHSILLRGVNFESLFSADGWSLQSLAANPLISESSGLHSPHPFYTESRMIPPKPYIEDSPRAELPVKGNCMTLPPPQSQSDCSSPRQQNACL